MPQNTVSLSGAQCRCAVQAAGGMLGPAAFTIGAGRVVEPLAVAPWADDPPEQLATIEPILRRLRGEWPCVPFGVPMPPEHLPADWQPQPPPSPEAWNGEAHGYGSHHDWQFDAVTDDSATLSIAYPDDHPIAGLRRGISIAQDAARIDVDLEVMPRRDCSLPIGLHPVLNLPQRPHTVRLGFAEGARAWTFPLPVEPGRSALGPDQRDGAPDAILDAAGQPCDLRRALPFASASEDLVLLTGTDGWIDFDNLEQGYRVSIRWDPADFPACLLWISNGGRQFYPWSGRFHGIGIEPVAAPFDLGTAIASDSANPLARAGTPTAHAFSAGVPWRTRYSIACSALPA